MSWVLPVAYFCTTMCVFNYTTIRTHAFTCMLMHICRFIYFKDAILIAKLRVEIIMTCISLLWQWHPNRYSVRMLSFQNILPSCNNWLHAFSCINKKFYIQKPLHLTIQRQLFLKFPNSLAALFSARSSSIPTVSNYDKNRRKQE